MTTSKFLDVTQFHGITYDRIAIPEKNVLPLSGPAEAYCCETYLDYVGLELLAAVVMKSSIFRVDEYTNLETSATFSSETSADFQQAA
jgi:hypothetical protein